MDASYADFVEDFHHFRSLGASEESLVRFQAIMNHYFCLLPVVDQMQEALDKNAITIARLQEQLFGKSGGKGGTPEPSDPQSKREEEDEETSTEDPSGHPGSSPEELCDSGAPPQESDPTESETAEDEAGDDKKASTKEFRTGRLSADAYTGAPQVLCTHESLKPGDTCAECGEGRLYEDKASIKKKINIDATPPLFAVCYILQVLRCALCGTRFTASAPVNLEDKYTPLARSIIAFLHCGMGMPYHRLANLQQMVGMPVPASTQSYQLEKIMGPIYPVVYELIYRLANSDLIYQDDTYVKILELMRENRLDNPERKGMFSSAFVTESPNPIVLYLTGRQHAGENFDDLMKQREQGKEPPKRMADALSANTNHEAESIDLNCNAHAVRRFKSIDTVYPTQSKEILARYKQIYQHKAHCDAEGYTPKERLAYYQKHSAPIMQEIETLIKTWFKEKRVEPNSALGRELKYLVNHWYELTQFLRIEGAPLDNNLCERLLKILIMYRKNSQIYVTQYSAYNLNLITSLIATCQLNEVDFIIYMTCLQLYEERVWARPDQWLPWNYQKTLESMGQSPPTYATLRQSSAMAA